MLSHRFAYKYYFGPKESQYLQTGVKNIHLFCGINVIPLLKNSQLGAVCKKKYCEHFVYKHEIWHTCSQKYHQKIFSWLQSRCFLGHHICPIKAGRESLPDSVINSYKIGL